MIDILDTTGTDTCRNCGNKIVRLSGSMTEEHWSHLPLGENKGRFVVHCPGAPKAR